MNELLTEPEVKVPETVSPTLVKEKTARKSLMINRSEIKGLLWVIGSFIICPCHLPLTLGLIATILGGTIFGIFVQQYWFVLGFLLTIAWVAGTRRGFGFLSQKTSCAIPQKKMSKKVRLS